MCGLHRLYDIHYTLGLPDPGLPECRINRPKAMSPAYLVPRQSAPRRGWQIKYITRRKTNISYITVRLLAVCMWCYDVFTN